MIYITDDTTQQEVFIPSATGKQKGSLTFALYSTVNRDTPFSVTVTDLADTDTYYHFNITLSTEIPQGEYEYTLTIGTSQVACGLAFVGDDGEQKTEYNNTIEYEQYETE